MNGNQLQHAGMTSLALALWTVFGVGVAEAQADARPRRQPQATVHKARRPSVAAPRTSLVRTPNRTAPGRSPSGRHLAQPRDRSGQIRYTQPAPPRGYDNRVRYHHQPRPERAVNYYTPRCSAPSVGYVRPPVRCATPTVRVQPTVRYSRPGRRYWEPTVYVQPAIRYTEPTVRYVEPSVYVEPSSYYEPAPYIEPPSYLEPAWYGGAVGYVQPAPVVTAYSYQEPRYYAEPTVIRVGHRVPTCEVRRVYTRPRCRDWSAGISLSWGKSRCQPHRGWHGWRPHHYSRPDRHRGGIHIRLGR